MPTLPESLARFVPVIEASLRDSLADGPPELIRACRYVMGWETLDGTAISGGTGKRIRPALVMVGASLFSERPEIALPGAVAVELVHNFSLVHDEIQDRDMERHGRPTLYAALGEAQSINAGDFLYARAINALTSAEVSAEVRISALQMLQDAITQMIGGQWSDIAFESRSDVSVEEYAEMVAGKTGAMLAVPMAIGAVLAGASPEVAQSLRSWGETVGLAFQIQDDYLGIWGDPNLTGKSNVNDLVRKKKTLPVIHGLTTAARSTIEAAYAKDIPTVEDIELVVEALNEADSGAFTRQRAQELVAEANARLASLDVTEAQRNVLREVGEYLVNRDA